MQSNKKSRGNETVNVQSIYCGCFQSVTGYFVGTRNSGAPGAPIDNRRYHGTSMRHPGRSLPSMTGGIVDLAAGVQVYTPKPVDIFDVWCVAAGDTR